MTRYELLYIIPTSFTDEEVIAVEQKVASVLVKFGGSVESTKRLGKFRLTYPIKGERHGHYVLVMFMAEKPMIMKIDEMLRITPEVLRHLILRADEAGSDERYELVQWTEVNVEREDRPRRRERVEAKSVKEEDLKAGVAALEEGKGAAATSAAPSSAMTAEELEKKIESALSEDAKDV